MTKFAIPFARLCTVLVCCLPVAPAHATGAPRTFVSAAGSDSNNCSNVATPCRHLAAAFAATAANGEIYVLDPANYGSLTITGPVSIQGHGWASIAPPSGGNAITINANPGDKINIVGVVLDGTTLTGTAGIVFNSGGSLTVADSMVRNFASDGILVQPSSGTLVLQLSDVMASDNGAWGIEIAPSGTATVAGLIKRATLSNNSSGATIVNGSNTTGKVDVTIVDSAALGGSNSPGDGFDATAAFVVPGNTTMSLDNVTVNNCNYGVKTTGNATVWMMRSAITRNVTGIQDFTVVPQGIIYSFGNNYIAGNTQTGGPAPIAPQ